VDYSDLSNTVYSTKQGHFTVYTYTIQNPRLLLFTEQRPSPSQRSQHNVSSVITIKQSTVCGIVGVGFPASTDTDK